MLHDLFRGRLFRLLALSVAIFVAAALLTDRPNLVLVLNGLTLSIAAGVAAAYSPVAASALLAARVTRGDLLALGIWLSWLATFMIRLSSIAARDFGHSGLLMTDYSSAYIFLGLLAGICHLFAPTVDEGRVPTRSWLLFGALTAAGVLVSFCVAILKSRPAMPFPF